MLRTTMNRRIIWVVLATVVPSGCLFSPKKTVDDPPPPKHYPALVSPDSVIVAFEQSYADQNYEEFTKLFDPRFTFAFAQVDLDQDPDLPPTWGRTEEFDSTRGLFDSEIVSSVRCDLSARDVAVPATDADQLDLSPLDLAHTLRVNIRQAQVGIETVDENGGPLTLEVPGDSQEFFIFADTTQLTENGLPVHRIIYWKDKAIGTGGGGGLSTTGEIRLRFRD